MIPIPWMTMTRMIHLMMKKMSSLLWEKAESVLNVAVGQGKHVLMVLVRLHLDLGMKLLTLTLCLSSFLNHFVGAVVVAQGVGGEEAKVIHAAGKLTFTFVCVLKDTYTTLHHTHSSRLVSLSLHQIKRLPRKPALFLRPS